MRKLLVCIGEKKQRQMERDRERKKESLSCLGTRKNTWVLVLAVVDVSVFLQSERGQGQRTSLSTHLHSSPTPYCFISIGAQSFLLEVSKPQRVSGLLHHLLKGEHSQFYIHFPKSVNLVHWAFFIFLTSKISW